MFLKCDNETYKYITYKYYNKKAALLSFPAVASGHTCEDSKHLHMVVVGNDLIFPVKTFHY